MWIRHDGDRVTARVDEAIVFAIAAHIGRGASVRTESHRVGLRSMHSADPQWACTATWDETIVPALGWCCILLRSDQRFRVLARQSAAPPALEWHDVPVETEVGLRFDTHYDLDWSAAGAALVFVRTVGQAFATAALAAAQDLAAETMRTR